MKKDIFVANKLKSIYDEYYEDGESEWRRLSAIGKASNIIGLCSQLSPETILDIGSGEGSVLRQLSDLQFGDALYSIEISKSAIDTIRRRDIKSLVECKLFDGYSIPYEDNTFSLAILTHVLEHLEYPRKMLYEASRAAKHVFVEVPLGDTIRLKRDFKLDKVGHINCYSPKTIRRLIQSCGLEILCQMTTNPAHRVYKYQSRVKGSAKYLLKELMLRTMPSMATGLYTYHCSLICKKKAM